MKRMYSVIALGVCMGFLFYASCASAATGYNSQVEHVVVSLPSRFLVNHVVDEDEKKVTVTFPGLSVVQLQDHCVHNPLNGSVSRLMLTVKPAAQGAALVLDMAQFAEPTVTLLASAHSSQLIIGVYDEMPIDPDWHRMSGALLQSV